MLRALILTFALAAPAAAFDLGAMTDAEREAFRAEVRAYLLENPEVLMEAIGVLEDRRAEQQAQADLQLVEDNRAALFEDPDSWVGGNPEGDITLVEFLDYRCGYCRQAHPEVLDLLKGDGNIRYVVKEFPVLGEQSLLAARFAVSVLRIAGDEAYGQVHDAMMTFRGEFTGESLARLATDFGLDAPAIIAGMADPETDAVIAANHQLAEKLQINGTPGFVFEDRLVRGYVPYDQMLQLIGALRG